MKRTSTLVITTVALVLMLALAAPAQTVNCSGVTAWVPNIQVSVGELVTFNGQEFKTLQAHTTLAGWEPPNVQALFSLVGNCGTSPTPTPTPTPKPTPTPTATPRPTATATATPKPTATATATPKPTATATPRPTATPTATPKPTPTPSGPGCWATWSASAVYNGGAQVSFNGVNYQAAFWTQNQEPDKNNGPAGSGAPWISQGACGGGPTPTPTATPKPTATPTATATATATPKPTPTATPGPPPTNNGRVLAGYWHDWETPVWIPLRNVPSSYDLIVVAFANYDGGGKFSFTVDPAETQAQFISDVQYLHGLGKKVIISCGGAIETPTFSSSGDASNFASSISSLMNTFGFDGVDIDFENGAVFLNQGDLDINNPTTPSVVYLIQGLKQLKSMQPHAMITFAPIPNYLQAAYQFYGPGKFGGQSNWNGAQLPVINNVRDITSYVWPQYYNECNIQALDNNAYCEGSGDNLVGMSEMLMTSFPVAWGAGTWQPLRQNQVVLGVPASPNASPGNMSNSALEAAFNYLMGSGGPVGSYTLRNAAGYPNVAGFMTWSINWDVHDNNGTFGSGIHGYLAGLPAAK